MSIDLLSGEQWDNLDNKVKDLYYDYSFHLLPVYLNLVIMCGCLTHLHNSLYKFILINIYMSFLFYYLLYLLFIILISIYINIYTHK